MLNVLIPVERERERKYSPSFLGTQSRPKVNFLIWITRWSGNEAKRVVLETKIYNHTEETKKRLNEN